MKTKKQNLKIRKTAMILSFVVGGTFLVSCNGAEAEAEADDITDSDVIGDVVDTDSADVINEQIDTFTVAPDLIDELPDEAIETTTEEG